MARRDTFKRGDEVVVEAASRLDGPAIVRWVEPDGMHVEVESLDPAVRAEASRIRVSKVYLTHVVSPRGSRNGRRW